MTASLYDLDVRSLEGAAGALAAHRGKVALVVNVASQCGFTPQYAGLEALHRELSGRGLVVLGFPSNEFGAQEPGDASEIRAFCETRFGVSFPLFEKCEVKPGPGQSPVYALLSSQTGDSVPMWNFCKYLVGRDGRAIRFYSSRVAPDDASLRADLEAALAAG